MSARPGPHPLKLAAVALAFAALAATAMLWQPTPISAQAVAEPAPASGEFYTQKVEPIFKANCFRCHAGQKHSGALRLDSATQLMRGGKDGSVITPGHPELSLLIALIRHEGPADNPMPMPPKSKLTEADIATVTAWIQAGAILPGDVAPPQP